MFFFVGVSILAVLTGLVGFFWIGWSPMSGFMKEAGLLINFMIPVLPSAMLVYLGYFSGKNYATPVSRQKRYWLSSVTAVCTVLVWVSFYAIATGDLPTRHAAFNWSFYLLAPLFVAHKVEVWIFLRHG